MRIAKRDMIGNLLSIIREIEDIHEFIGVLAKYIALHDDECSHYTQWIVSRDSLSMGIRQAIGFQIDSFLMQPENGIRDFIVAWILEVRKDVGNLHLYCLFTVFRFDSDYIERNIRGDVPEITGPLDWDPILTNGYRVYEKPPEWFQEKFFKKNSIRHGRNIQDYMCCNALKEIKNYIFIDEGKLGEKRIIIKKYIPPVELTEKPKLKALLCPISNKKWFEPVLDKANESFRISYPNTEDNNAINKKICQVIEYAAREKASIVVFPEITANAETTNIIQNYLFTHDNIKDQVVLIFLGTYWDDIGIGGINKGTVLSGSGTPLFEATKKWKFEYYSPTDNKLYKEDLADTGEQVVFLDIPGWGRISWEICIEFLRESHHICHTLGTNIQIVSSYTDKVGEMENQASEDCKTNGTITAFVNHCLEETSGGKHSGFFAIPVIESEKKIGCQMIKGVADCDGKCCLGEPCGYLYTITPNLISYTQQIEGLFF